ncbi:hypothetical protein CYMTET_30616 [Cymbomonas tetramitiformis]|uniref:Uncharacterized protein n=1 Tax=Cymbomonas tetramitiformis TaxID=36881 RepID=A0AAE0FIN5_9CHLO|nr:hypothetical protein CYMTET_30616 [Cymbomonas tetramitiformis]
MLSANTLFCLRRILLALTVLLAGKLVDGRASFPRIVIPETRSLFEQELSTRQVAQVCIVCSEFAGIVPNGGIGTFYSTLAESLVAVGNHVTLLYTQGTKSHHPEQPTFEYWRRCHPQRPRSELVACEYSLILAQVFG